jgi:hypothetical protein
VRLRRGIKAWSEYLTRHLEVGGRAARGGRRRWEKAATVGRRGRKTKLIARPHLVERREGGGQLGRRKSKGKTYFRNYAIDTWAERLGPTCGLRPTRDERPAGWLGQRPSGVQGQPSRK